MQFGIGHPPTYTSIAVYMCGGGFKGPKSSNRIQLSRFVQKMAFLVILLSPWSADCPCHPHVVLVSSPSSPHCPHSPQKVPMWSPWLWSPWSPPLSPPHVVPMVPVVPCSPHRPHIVPIIPTSSLLSPRRLHHPHIVPIAPRRSPCGPHGCGLHGLLRCLHPMLSPWSL